MPMKKLVIGASGFLGSHVARQLVDEGADVRVMLRPTSVTRGIDDLDVQRCYGDVFDEVALREAMRDCDVVYYCAVDTRAWLRDSSPLFRTNVLGLAHVLGVASEADLHRFVFTSTVATIGRCPGQVVDETEPFNWRGKGGAYVRSRVQAENLVLRYATQGLVPAVAMCVANTYGSRDWQPTPHGSFIAAAALGKMPVQLGEVGAEAVGVVDAARALVRAGEVGRIGERYIISQRFVSLRELLTTAAAAADRTPPRLTIPLPLMYVIAAATTAVARIRKAPDSTEPALTPTSVRLMHVMSRMDHSKAERELDWHPEPVLDAVAEAARFFVEQRTARRAARSRDAPTT